MYLSPDQNEDPDRDQDQFFMKRALTLAARGRPKNNPFVGAVIVSDGKIIGEGFHKGDGKPHAEAEALASLSSDLPAKILSQATIYCSLEPCSESWKGKVNPPCTKAIIKSGIRRVVIASVDPNPYVNGQGVEILRAKGLIVKKGVLAEEERYLNRKYRKQFITKRPYIHLKMAQTLDGYISERRERPVSVTGKDVQKEVHRLRARYHGVLIGLGTAIADNPQLSVREAEGENPIRIVLDRGLNLSLLSNLADTSQTGTIVCHGQDVSASRIHEVQSAGMETLLISKESKANDLLSLDHLTKILFERGINSLLVEGGSRVATSFLAQRLVDEVTLYFRPGWGGYGISCLDKEVLNGKGLWNSSSLRKTEVKKIGEDFCITGLTEEGIKCLRD